MVKRNHNDFFNVGAEHRFFANGLKGSNGGLIRWKPENTG